MVPEWRYQCQVSANIGEVSNQGVELMLSHKNRINDINYFVSGNFTFTKNKIKFFDEAANTPEWQRRTGHSIDSWLMYKTDGIYQSWDEINSTPHMANAQPGDIKYLDIDDNGVINDNDRIRSKYGNVPQIVYGLNMGIGWNSIIYLAALSSIDQEQYEAARVDGANRFQQMLHITLPGLVPTIMVLFILRMGNILNVGYEKILLLYNSATYSTADVISTYTYRLSFGGSGNPMYSKSTAIGLFNTIINVFFLMLTNMISKKATDAGLF